ncbi:MAG: toll/interleukin-1 receptor domain-containing protein [Verrucomicrobiota bacterium]
MHVLHGALYPESVERAVAAVMDNGMLEKIWRKGTLWSEFMPIRVFLSHSSEDSTVATALIQLIRSALALPATEIRCTSVDGYRLGTGVLTDDVLRAEALQSDVFVALITPASIKSTYVLFELGARWGVQKPLFPLLARGFQPRELRGPLTAINARVCVSPAEVHQFIDDMAAALGATVSKAAVFVKDIEEFIKVASSTAHETRQSSAEIEATNATESLGRKGLIVKSARELCREINSMPPLQQDNYRANYVGCEVNWETEYTSASQRDGKIEVMLIPWEPNGCEVGIFCSTTLEKNPEFANLPKNALVRVRGAIRKISFGGVDLGEPKLAVMTTSESSGTRVKWLVSTVRKETRGASDNLSDQEIEDFIKSQVRMGRPEGLSLVEDRIIRPEVKEGSAAYQLVILYTSQQIIECASLSDQQRESRLFAIRQNIYKLENFG